MEILDENSNRTGPEKIIIVKEEAHKSNGIGIAGFVFTLLGFIGFWIPVFNVMMSALGFIFSLIGVFKRPRGFAIAGLSISVITFIIITTLLGLIMTFIRGR